jgi:hypothetical protein
MNDLCLFLDTLCFFRRVCVCGGGGGLWLPKGMEPLQIGWLEGGGEREDGVAKNWMHARWTQVTYKSASV